MLSVVSRMEKLLVFLDLEDATMTLPFSSRPSLAADDSGICKSTVETQGYVCEEHMVTTKDGYILTIQRIPVGRSGKKPDKPPVLLQHGIMIDAATWVLNSPDESLAFILADNGFDVWLANTRGTKYSRRHTNLSPSDSAYWDWSWDELAAYDLPAFVQYVHDQTGQKLHYVGHSLLLDMGQLPSQLMKAGADSFLAEALYWLGLSEFIPGEDAVGKLVEDICELTHSNCTNLMAAFTGNSCCVNSSRIDFLLRHEPQPTATKNMVHLSQTLGTRTKLFSTQSRVAVSAFDDGDGGICKLMVETQGYSCEEHTVTTQDGYILSIQRIPNGKSGETSGGKQPVLLQHGLLMDGITWLLSPPDQSLALILADNEFDVWIASTRGTLYSRGHTSLSPDDAPYWDWTWDELVAYDLPATFQYVNDQTGQKLHYVGHSLGTLIALASFSKGQLTDKLRSAALLSPIAYLGQMTSPLATKAAENFIAENLYWLGVHEFNPRGDAVVKLLKAICSNPGIDCTNLMTSFTGQNCCLNSSIVQVFLEHEPQATSTKNMIHVAQMIRQGTITMYDYNDEEENNKHYGQSTPPAYDMSSIPHDVPLFLSYGGQDALSVTNDVETLLKSLKGHDPDKLVVQYREPYAHADYVMADNAKEQVYDPVMAFFKLHS